MKRVKLARAWGLYCKTTNELVPLAFMDRGGAKSEREPDEAIVRVEIRIARRKKR